MERMPTAPTLRITDTARAWTIPTPNTSKAAAMATL
jgi:hypothetical protein